MNTTQIPLYDLVVIGGGIHGVGVAADAAGRGLCVLLCEQDDLASGTSSTSSKLIHGGLRYLEHYDFGLVRTSLKERDILFKTAPHLVRPQQFIVPYQAQHRPFWMIRMGLFCYDWLAPRPFFQRSKSIQLDSLAGNRLHPAYRKGFIYSDATVDDARLVIITALRAAEKGAHILTKTKCLQAKRTNTFWEVQLHDTHTGKTHTIQSKALVNATGPWIDHVMQESIHAKSRLNAELSKGSHIVVPKLFSNDFAYVLQHPDGRIVFVIPYLEKYTLIGTTDCAFTGDPHCAHISFEEIAYLCGCVNQYFRTTIKSEDIVYSWSGVRSLVQSKNKPLSAISREYQCELTYSSEGTLPLVNIFGGKLTTYRQLAEEVLALLKPTFLHCGKPWTSQTPLPGGDIPCLHLADFTEELIKTFSFLSSAMLQRYAKSYGTLAYHILDGVTQLSHMGDEISEGFYEKELAYLIQNEWAKTTDDILWRRTKLGLSFSPSEKETLTHRLSALL